MSLKTTNTASIVINHDIESVAQVLLDVERLPQWNPAFSSVSPSAINGQFTVIVKRVIRGTITQTQPDSRTIRFHISIPGLVEESTFELDPQNRGTRVTHSITQEGMLTFVIGDAEASLVPEKRLIRLAKELG